MDPDYFKAYETFVLYYNDTSGWGLTGVCKDLYLCYTDDTTRVKLPNHFVGNRDVEAVYKVAQNRTKTTKREVQVGGVSQAVQGAYGSYDIQGRFRHGSP